MVIHVLSQNRVVDGCLLRLDRNALYGSASFVSEHVLDSFTLECYPRYE